MWLNMVATVVLRIVHAILTGDLGKRGQLEKAP